MTTSGAAADVVVVGAGAAGLATAIFAARRAPGLRIVVLDGARTLGAKILVSGGGRCNVTNATVTAADFWRPGSPFVRRVLRDFTVDETVSFFEGLGVGLKEEPGGKLFPETNRARTVLSALVEEAGRLQIQLLPGHRVLGLHQRDGAFVARTSEAAFAARKAVLATGGLSLPKTGSDGAGYAFATSLGHSLVPTTPALAPLVLRGTFHAPLSGVSHDAELRVTAPLEKPARVRGSVLWTHFGVSGPAALDASRFWHRHDVAGRAARVSMSLLPGRDFGPAEAEILAAARSRPTQRVASVLAGMLPAAVAEAVVAHLGVEAQATLGKLRREDRRRLLAALFDWPLPVEGSRGYNFAEATSGGIPLEEVDPATMESRIAPGLHLVGEMLDVDGRIGGFNFQWAWSSAHVAAAALASGATRP